MTHAERFDIKYGGKLIRLSVKLRWVSDDFVVLLHGFGCAKECFDEAFVAEGLQDLSICTFDFPGHGHSEQSNTSVYSLQSYADITNVLLEKLAPKKVSMVCHSMGGAVGLIATQERSDVAMFVNVEGNLVALDCGIVSRSTASQSFGSFSAMATRIFSRTCGDPDVNQIRPGPDGMRKPIPARCTKLPGRWSNGLIATSSLTCSNLSMIALISTGKMRSRIT